jgi:Mn2+/Fe2+ NRAMP family transporter
MEGINYGAILSVALCTVGITQIVKNFIGKDIGFRWGIGLTLIVGCAISALYIFLPGIWEKVCVVLLSISGATIFYDTIYKSFRKIFEKLGKDSSQTYKGED